MFEVTTRLPNSFAFKNQSKPMHSHNHRHHHQYTPTSSQVIRDHRIAYPLPASTSANTYRPMRHQMPIYFGQTNSASHPSESSFVSRSNPRVNISNPYFYEHNGTNSSSKPPLQRTKENVTVLPVYYKSEKQGTNLPNINNSPSSSPNLRSSSYVNKIQINGSQLLPPLLSDNGNLNHHTNSGDTHSTSNFHEQLAAHQRRLNSLDRLNIINGSPASHGQRSHSLNMNRYNSLPHGSGSSNGNQQSVIYSHDASMPTFSTVSASGIDDNRISVIKGIKARQDMFLYKHGKMNSEEEEEENRHKYNFEDTKKTLQQEENELNLLKRNFNNLFLTNKNAASSIPSSTNSANSSYKNLNSSSQFKNSENLSQAETNYRNTLLNTDKKLRNIKARQGSVDRLRLEVNDTPISDVSSMASNSKLSNSSPTSCMSDASGGKKSILVKKNKGPKEKKSVSFAEV